VVMSLRYNSGHFNPIFSFMYFITMWLRGETVGLSVALTYVVVWICGQIMGSFLAALALLAVFGIGSPLGTPILAVWIEPARAWFLIVMASGLYYKSMLHLFINRKDVGFNTTSIAVVCGMICMCLLSSTLSITGGVVDITRWLVPAICSVSWSNSWVFATGPLLGAALAWILFALFGGVFEEGRPFTSYFSISVGRASAKVAVST